MPEVLERLQKLLAEAGVASRRKAEQLIQEGRVTVNGRIVTQLGTKVNPALDEVRVDGQKVKFSGHNVYLMLNKPRGVLSVMEDTRGQKSLGDLVQVPQRVFPVGRLDAMSEGLILLTDDGELANLLTHPRYEHEKEYRALVNGIPSDEALEAWRRGIVLEGQQTAPAQVEILRKERDSAYLRIVMHEGRKRQVREVAALLGHPVRQLQRVRLGPLHLGTLKPGEWRHLTGAEVEQLTSIQKKAGGAKPGTALRKARVATDGKPSAGGTEGTGRRPAHDGKSAEQKTPGPPARRQRDEKPAVQEGKKRRSVPPSPTRPVKPPDDAAAKRDRKKRRDKAKKRG
ncbi:MAG TPA: pseudouridine synthase [Anaerolineae bacterium]|nr:pseudouridine synthase [Anaerolineae bacterium]